MKRSYAIVTASNNDEVLKTNLLSSPDLNGEVELTIHRGAVSAAQAYNAGIDRTQAEILIFVHQDVYLPENWLQRLDAALDVAFSSDPNWGLIGIYGADEDGRGQGLVHSTGLSRTLGCEFHGLRKVQTLDEVMLVMRRSSGLRFDERLGGFHLYGADICLQALDHNMTNYAVSLFCVHNSGGMRMLPRAYWECYFKVRRKWWHRLPIMTPCMPVTRSTIPAISYVCRTTISLLWNRKRVGGRIRHPQAILAARKGAEALLDERSAS